VAQQNRLRVQQRLLHAAARLLDRGGLRASDICQARIEWMIGNALTRMERDGVLEREGQLFLAERNLALLFDELRERAEQQRSFPIVTDAQFDEVYNTSCPIWPYC
jgi:hypothetical protein